MPYFRQVATDQITLPSDEHYWVRLKQKMSYGDRRRVQGAMVKMALPAPDLGRPPDAPSEPVELTPGDITEGTAAMLLAMVVEWNLDDEQGRILPITKETIDALDPNDADFLVGEAGKRQGGRPEVEQGPFPSPSPAPSSDTE